jgi:hypothetical protein
LEETIMKRIIAIIMAVLMIGALLAACGAKTVKTTVDAKYDDGFAKSYANSVTTDSNGNSTYEFSDEQYEKFEHDYKNSIANEVTDEVLKYHEPNYGEYNYIKPEENALIIGVNPGQYVEAEAAAEAPAYGAYAMKYFQSISKPVSTIKIVFCNANNQSEVYGTFEYTAE